jgi:hypothetical protein
MQSSGIERMDRTDVRIGMQDWFASLWSFGEGHSPPKT